MDIKILATNIVNNPSDFTAEEIEAYFVKYGILQSSLNPSVLSEFWKKSGELMDTYRKEGDERAAEGVVSCRILIDGLNRNYK